MALTGDVMVRFNEWQPDHYRLFNIRSVVAPSGAALPEFLMPRAEIGPFRVFEAPGTGYFDVVDVPAAIRITRRNFYDVNDRWLQSDWVARKQYLWLTISGNAPTVCCGFLLTKTCRPRLPGLLQGLLRVSIRMARPIRPGCMLNTRASPSSE
jgi:hypothetical protein